MKKTNKAQLIIMGIILISFAIVLDQITKLLAIDYLKGSNGISIIDSVFRLQYLENKGAAFGIMQNQQLFFIILGTIICIAMIYIYAVIPVDKKFLPLRICMIFIFAGAVGNMIDRVLYNFVVDFLYFELIDFPIFNVADIYVTVSTIIFSLLILFYYKESDFDTLWNCILKRPLNKSDIDKVN